MCNKLYYRSIFTVCVLYFSEIYGKEADYPKQEEINSLIFYRLERGKGITFSSINKEGLIKSADGKLYTECRPQEKQDAKHVGCDGTTVINADLRQRVILQGWPTCLIGKLEIQINKSKKIASGILVGPNHVLTCAHNVFNTPSFAERILFYPESSPENNPYNWFEVAGYFIASGFLQETLPHDDKVEEYDLALLVLTRPACFKGKRIGYAGMHCLLRNDLFLGVSQFQVSGYPTNKKEKDGYAMCTHSGSIVRVEERTLHYNIATSPGQSGGPIWMNVESEPRVYGVHTHGTDTLNYGTRITERFFTELVDWISQTWMIVSSGEPLQPALGQLDVQKNTTPQSTHTESVTHTSIIEILKTLHPCINQIPWYIKDLFPKELRHMDFVLDNIPTAVHYQVYDFFELGCERIGLPHPPFKRSHSEDLVESIQKHFAYLEQQYPDNPEKLYIQTCALQKVIVYYAVIIVDVIKSEGKNPYEDDLWHSFCDLYHTNLININKTGRKWSIDYKTRKNTQIVNRPQINMNFIESFIPTTCESHLTKLYRDLLAQGTVVITGMGGVGKSTLAAQFAQEAITHKAFDAICWVNAENEAGIRSAYLKVIDWIEWVLSMNKPSFQGQERFVAQSDMPMRAYMDRISYLLEAKYDYVAQGHEEPLPIIKSLLFIYDNAPSYSAIQDVLLPQHVRNIITTRNQDVPDESNARKLALDVFSDQEAVHYIKKRITKPASIPLESYNTQVKVLAEKLEYHPLALALACGYMKDEDIDELNGEEPVGMNLKIFLDRFDQLFQKLAHYERHGTYPTNLYIALKMSLDKLTDSERDTFFRLCYLNSDHVPIRFLGRYDRFRKPCLTLAKHSLITIIEDETSVIKTLSMHRLIQDIGRIIHERQADLNTSETLVHIQEMLTDQMCTLEHQALSYYKTFQEQKGDAETLKQFYENVTQLKDHWLTLMKHMQAHEGLMRIDENGFCMRQLQNKIADKLLTFSPDHEDVILKRQTKLNDADFQRLQAIYQDHFSSITDPEYKKQIYVKLAKFYNNDFTKYVDWSFFDGADRDDLNSILDILISMNTLDNSRLQKIFDTAKTVQENIGSNPYHRLLAVRCEQERAEGTPFVFHEALSFIQKLCTKHVGTSFHRHQNAIHLWAQLPPYLCVILEKLPIYDENVIMTLMQFANIRLQPTLNLYMDLSLRVFDDINEHNQDFALGPIKNGEEAALLVSGFQYFYNMLCQLSRLLNPQMNDLSYIEHVMQQKPSLQYVTPYLQHLNETLSIDTNATPAQILQALYGANHQNMVTQLGIGYLSLIADILKQVTYDQNRMIAYSALLKHYAVLSRDVLLGQSKNGADDETLLDALSRMQHLLHDTESMARVQNKTAELLGISPVQQTSDAREEGSLTIPHAPLGIGGGMPAHKAFTLLDIVDRVGDQLNPLLDQIDSHALPLETTYDRIQVASILYDLTENTQTQDAQTHKRTILLEHLKNLMHFGYTVQQVPHLLGFYMKHHPDLLSWDTQRFSTIAPNLRADNDGDLILFGKALPFVAQDRLNAVLKHPFLMPPLSFCPFAHMMAMAARMDNHLWNQWIANPMNANAYKQYMQTVVLPYYGE